MNVIMGVNGSGKSSIFVGLIVGLGGDLKVLNRQNNLMELINRNSKSANIVIMLVDNVNFAMLCFCILGKRNYFNLHRKIRN